MALEDLFPENDALVPELVGGSPQAFTREDVLGASYLETEKNYTSDGKLRAAYNLSLERNREYAKITGRSFEDDFNAYHYKKTGSLDTPLMKVPFTDISAGIVPYQDVENLMTSFDDFIEEKRLENPKLANLKTRGQIDLLVKQEMVGAKRDYVRVKEGAPDDWLTWGYGAIGAMAGAMRDRQNIYSSVATLGISSGATYLKTALNESLTNMLQEIPTQQDIQKAQESIGEEYTLKDKVVNVLTAGGAGWFFGSIGYLPKKWDNIRSDRAAKELMDQILKKIDLEKELEMKAAMELAQEANRIADYAAPLDSAGVSIEAKQRAMQRVDEIIESGSIKDFDELVDGDFLNPELIKKINDPNLREALEYRVSIAKGEAKIAQVRKLVDEGAPPTRVEQAVKAAKRALRNADYPDDEIAYQIDLARKGSAVEAPQPEKVEFGGEKTEAGFDAPTATELKPPEEPIDLAGYHKQRAEGYVSPARDAERLAGLSRVSEMDGKLKKDMEKSGLNPATMAKELNQRNALEKAITKCAVNL